MLSRATCCLVGVFIMLNLLTGVSRAQLNLYMNEHQVKNLMGVTAELYYVKQGAVNDYAMRFVVPIPAKISQIEFVWYSKPFTSFYTWTIEYQMGEAMLTPVLNISSEGMVPTEPTYFSVHFPCTGLKSAEVAVYMRLNLTSPPMYLLIKRNKICLKGNSSVTTLDPPKNMSVSPAQSPVDPNSSSLYLAATSASALVLSILLLAAYIKKKKSGSQPSIHSSYSYGMSGAYLGNPNVFIRLESADSGSYATIETCHKENQVSPYATTYVTASDLPERHIYTNPQSTISYTPSHVSDKSRVLELGRESLKTGTLLHEGTYGQIFTSTNFIGPKLMVKTVSESATQLQATMLLCEGTRLSCLVHEFLLPVLAASSEPVHRPIIVYPCPSRGNLKKFLWGCVVGEVATQELVSMAVQVARACHFLHSQSVLHRDIATRNCYLDGRQVRVGDSALARDLFPEDYYRIPGEAGDSRAIRWLPPEAIAGVPYTQHTDVWMFGVLLWELVTLAKQPYSGLEPYRIEEFLLKGNRLEQPMPCPQQLYGVMQLCWMSEPTERATFTQILAVLIDLSTALGPFL